MFWKKYKVMVKPPYEFNKDVSFEMAFKALKEGYMIVDWGYDDVFYIMVNNRIFCLHDRNNDHNCYQTEEFSRWGMLQNTWRILEPLSNRNIKNNVKN